MSVDTQRTQEAVATALVDKKRDASIVSDPMLRRRLEDKSRLEAGLASEKGIDATLREFASRRVESSSIQRNAEVAIGNSNPDSATGVRKDKGEFDRHRELSLNGKVLAEYTDAGNIDSVLISGLDGAEKQKIQEQAIDAVLEVAKVLPQIDAVFKKADGTPMALKDRRELVKGLLNDPEFVAVVKQVANEKINPEQAQQRLAEITAKQTEASRKLEDAKVETQRRADEHKKASAQLAEIDRLIGQFDNSDANKKDPLTPRAQLIQLDTAISTLTGGIPVDTYIAQQKALLEKSDNRLKLLGSATTETHSYKDAKLTDIHNERDTILSDLRKAEELAAKRKQIEEREASLREQRKLAEDEEMKARHALEDARRKEGFINADVALLKGERVALEQDMVRQGSANEVMSEAAQRYFTDRYDEMTEAHEAVLAEEKAKAETEAEKNVYDALARMWHRPEDRTAIGKFFKGDRGYVVDEKLVDAHFKALLTQPPAGGPDSLRGLLKDSTGAVIPLSDEQWTHVQGRVVQELIQRKLESGGMKEGEARLIFNSQWGKEALQKAQEENKKFNSEVLDQMKAQGLIEGSDFGSIMKFMNEHPVWSSLIMAILFGTVALPAGAIAGTMAAGIGPTGAIGMAKQMI